MKQNGFILGIAVLAALALFLGQHFAGDPAPPVRQAEAVYLTGGSGSGATTSGQQNLPGIASVRIEMEGFALDVSAVSGINNAHDVLDKNSGTQPGKLRWGVVAASRGLSDDTGMYEWRRAFIDDPTARQRRNLSVIYYDQTLAEIARFNFTSAWPCRYEVGPIDATSQTLMETVEICHNGFERA